MAAKTFLFPSPSGCKIQTTVALNDDHVKAWVSKQEKKMKTYKDDLSMGLACYWRKKHDRNAHTLAVAFTRTVLIIDLELVPVLPTEMKNWFSQATVYCCQVNETKKKLKFLEISFKKRIEVVGSLKTVMDDPTTMIGDDKKPRAIVASKTEVMSEEAARFATSEAYGCFFNGLRQNEVQIWIGYE